MNNLTWGQYKAIGRHALTYTAGAVTMAAAIGILSQGDAGTLTNGLNDIANGLAGVAKGVAAIAGVLVPIYTAYAASHSASPQVQIQSVVTNAASDPGGRAKLVNAVAEMPEVKGIVAPSLAASTSSDKVVAVAADIPPPVVEVKQPQPKAG